MIYTLTGQLPKHVYCFVDTKYTHSEPRGFLPVVWYGLVSYPGRVWGCTVMFEEGAIYRNLPPHALAFSKKPKNKWTEKDAQTWNCYGWDFSCLEYDYLSGLECRVKANKKELVGEYLFSIAPIGDSFSASPDQAKEFMFIKLKNGRLTIQPTNHIIFKESSFTTNVGFPKNLKRQNNIWKVE